MKKKKKAERKKNEERRKEKKKKKRKKGSKAINKQTSLNDDGPKRKSDQQKFKMLNYRKKPNEFERNNI